MKRISREQAMEYFFDGKREPVIRVEPGESFQVETEDAFSGQVKSLEDLGRRHTHKTHQTTPHLSNPMAGPVYVEGAVKGDVLAIRIEEIVVADIGRTYWSGESGPLRESARWPELGKPFFQEIHHQPGPSGTTRDGRGILNDRISWDLAPFIGTIGAAPDVEVETSVIGQGPWGGNMDCRDIKEGTIIYLPVFHEGGLLSLGDVHASQGDTEFYGTANETQAEVTLSCDIIKNKTIPFVRLEKAESIVSLYCYRPLENAVENAVVGLMEWMTADYGISPEEAYLFTCINPDFRVHVYQMVRLGRIQYTVGAEIPKRYLR